MKRKNLYDNRLTLLRWLTLTASVVLLVGCGDGGSDALKGDTIEVPRAALEKPCLPIAADGNLELARMVGLAVTTDTFMDPDEGGPLVAQTVNDYINSNVSQLGGRGEYTARTASISYFKATHQYSLYVCEALQRKGSPLVADPDALAEKVWGDVFTVDEMIQIQTLQAQVAGLGGSSSQQAIAACASVLSALETQCVQ